FLMLMKNARLASLSTSFDQAAHRLTIETVARQQKISADLRTTEGRAVMERFFADYCAGELRGTPRVLHADGHSFSDLARKVVSIINLAWSRPLRTWLALPSIHCASAAIYMSLTGRRGTSLISSAKNSVSAAAHG